MQGSLQPGSTGSSDAAAAAAAAHPSSSGTAAAAAAAAAEAVAAQPNPSRAAHLRTCRRCKQQFDPATNTPGSCRYHSALWTGGEISKAYGFVRQSAAPEHQLAVVMGRTGLVRFWDCCGAEQEDAPGCCTARHVTYDDPDD
ncbi:hypothetical protein COHA_007149 [Chlorella ohadii]|uniref:Uncharacterized protein n=1 Tax=Chlorella ohadii TaxID=2649997 RepID=A0AAD5DN06_9CHLO|nr:hypothetical protein COHA_007149 [Chlorella ohadii]